MDEKGPQATSCKLPCGWHVAKEIEEAAGGNDTLWAPARHQSCSEGPKGKKLEAPCPGWLSGCNIGGSSGTWPVLEPSFSRAWFQLLLNLV